MNMASDAIVPNAATQETRAITIDASTSVVWPWLAELGQDRMGFYSYDLLENLVGCEMPTADRLDPAKQGWKLGDRLWMYPKDKAGGAAFATLREYTPGHSLGFGTRMIGTTLDQPEDGSWSFALLPIDSGHTRFVVRGRGAPGRSPFGRAFDALVFEPMHFAMERRMMLGIKALAETGTRDRIANHFEVGLWTVLFGLFLTSAVSVLRRSSWRRPLAAFIGAGVLFQILTLGQPPLLLESLAVALVPAILWWPRTKGSSPVPVVGLDDSKGPTCAAPDSGSGSLV